MKFTIKFKNRPEDNDLRIQHGFLWFPKCINGECRWLEYAKWVQEFNIFCGEYYGRECLYGWKNIRWATEEDKWD